MVLKITHAAAEPRSFARATTVLNDVAGVAVSAKTIERVTHDVGRELAERRDADPRSDRAMARAPESPPELAVIECDGGRIRTREPGHGPGGRLAGEGWREDKNACLIRALRTTSEDAPQPEPPACFRDPTHAARIAATEAFSLAAPVPKPPAVADKATEAEAAEAGRPKRLAQLSVRGGQGHPPRRPRCVGPVPGLDDRLLAWRGGPGARGVAAPPGVAGPPPPTPPMPTLAR